MLANTNRKGFVLPFTLMMLGFTSIMLIAFGSQIGRLGSRLNSYERVSEIQLSTRNIIEIAAAYLVDSLEESVTFTSGNDWEDFDEFLEFASTRGGMEGTYWATVLRTLDSDDIEYWNLSNEADFVSHLNTDPSVFDTQDKGAVIYRHDKDTYSLISWTGTENTARRYSYGLFIRQYKLENPALELGSFERVLNQYRSGDDTTLWGDVVFGDVIIFDTITIADLSDPRKIFLGTVSASEVIPAFEGFDFTKPSTPVADYFEGLKNEHIDSLPSTTVEINLSSDDRVLPLVLDSNALPLDDETLLVVRIDPSIESVHKIRVEFEEDGDLVLSTLEVKNKKIEVKTSRRITGRDHKLFVRFDSDILVGDGDAKKMDLINGEYSITVVGDIDVTKSLVYEPLKSLFNNGNSINAQTDVSNKPLGQTEVNVSEVNSTLIAESSLIEGISLELVSIGGDINFFKETTSSHGVGVMHGDFKAFGNVNDDNPFDDYDDPLFPLTGGSIGLVVESEIDSKGSEFWVYGSLVGESFSSEDLSDFLKRFIAISRSEGAGSSSVSKGFSVVGIRSW
ncbi:hypothetical protein Theba_1311 [Mesotoga prima MesG1.Ag.4.2]|uniref:Uncharacterized protein n=1 Tax=Mesotoga prima MesG1.Ag.4.2 TaxID=660470 RepID=I2F4Z6_9BACT|nr:hypothetical protein [Mesotoga prima]AFK06999.1 hypothetical protein Theba_1311 [Mesotoga prima MesG1.Ag.4.2]HPJ81985.1 hypothetical protein [Saccharofermentans sp.]